jgi:hypothetical protein
LSGGNDAASWKVARLPSSTRKYSVLSNTIASINSSQNTPVLPNMRRSVMGPSGASCSRRNSAKPVLARHACTGVLRRPGRQNENGLSYL